MRDSILHDERYEEVNRCPIIYCLAFKDSGVLGYMAYGLAEDGKGLSAHASSSLRWAMHDIGFTSDWKHDRYRKYYPQGYRLVWLDETELDIHAGYQKAFALNQQAKEQGSE